ncbi:serine protease [Flavobacteriaceae bacterium]|nr:serine protease [Flavobacteriaceae bacterium]
MKKIILLFLLFAISINAQKKSEWRYMLNEDFSNEGWRTEVNKEYSLKIVDGKYLCSYNIKGQSQSIKSKALGFNTNRDNVVSFKFVNLNGDANKQYPVYQKEKNGNLKQEYLSSPVLGFVWGYYDTENYNRIDFRNKKQINSSNYYTEVRVSKRENGNFNALLNWTKIKYLGLDETLVTIEQIKEDNCIVKINNTTIYNSNNRSVYWFGTKVGPVLSGGSKMALDFIKVKHKKSYSKKFWNTVFQDEFHDNRNKWNIESSKLYTTVINNGAFVANLHSTTQMISKKSVSFNKDHDYILKATLANLHGDPSRTYLTSKKKVNGIVKSTIIKETRYGLYWGFKDYDNYNCIYFKNTKGDGFYTQVYIYNETNGVKNWFVNGKKIKYLGSSFHKLKIEQYDKTSGRLIVDGTIIGSYFNNEFPWKGSYIGPYIGGASKIALKSIKLIERVRETSTVPKKSIKQKIIKPKKSTGTGFAISSDGYIITNQHVSKGSKNIRVKGINGDFSTSYHAKVVKESKKYDLAILKIDDDRFEKQNELPYLINNSINDVGSSVYALGYPLITKMGSEIKLTNGIISSSSGYKGNKNTYQVSVPIQPGNSGGPLFNTKGEIIGVISSHLTNTENVSYAIKSSCIYKLLEETDDDLSLPTNNLLSNYKLPKQVKEIKNFVYLIEVN